MKDTLTLQLAHGFTTIVTKETFLRLGLDRINWTLNRHKRGHVYVASKFGLLHRHLTRAKKGQHVDHQNHDTLDNTDENLRLCSPGQNRANSRMERTNTVGYKGVWKAGKKWGAQIVVHGKNHYLGVYEDIRDAAKAYDRAAVEWHGEFACVNFPASKSDR